MRLVTVRDAVAEAHVSARLIGQMFEDGRLTKYRLTGGNLIRVDMDELYELFVKEE